MRICSSGSTASSWSVAGRRAPWPRPARQAARHERAGADEALVLEHRAVAARWPRSRRASRCRSCSPRGARGGRSRTRRRRVVGVIGVVWMTVPSWIDVRAPMTMPPGSPRSTALGQTDDSATDRDVADDDRVGVDVGGGVDRWARRRRGRRRPSAVRPRSGRSRRGRRASGSPVVADLEVADPAQTHEVVVTGVGDGVDVAVDPGQHAVEQRRTRAGGPSSRARRTCRRPCVAKTPADVLLVLGEDVHAERPGRLDAAARTTRPWSGKKPTSGGSSDTEANEPTARPTGPSASVGGDDGDPGREVTEHLAELGGVERRPGRSRAATLSGAVST